MSSAQCTTEGSRVVVRGMKRRCTSYILKPKGGILPRSWPPQRAVVLGDRLTVSVLASPMRLLVLFSSFEKERGNVCFECYLCLRLIYHVTTIIVRGILPTISACLLCWCCITVVVASELTHQAGKVRSHNPEPTKCARGSYHIGKQFCSMRCSSAL